MFSNEHQGGPFFEVISGQGKEPGGPWKLTGGSGIHRTYDNELKSFVFSLEGTPSSTKMQLPKDQRQSLSLIQRFLVLQLFIPYKADFALELNLTDSSSSRHRIFMSTSQKEISVTPLLAKVPLFMIKRNIWLNLCLDLLSFTGELWTGQKFRQLDCLVISANCKVARISTLKVCPADTTDDAERYRIPPEKGAGTQEPLPPILQLPASVPNYCQVLNISKLQLIEWRLKQGPALGGDSSAGSSSRENSAEVPRSAPVSSSLSSSRHRRCGSEPSGPVLEPHPPPEDSRANASRRRRRPRVKAGGSGSAGKESSPANGARSTNHSRHPSSSAGESRQTSADNSRQASAGTSSITDEIVATGHRLECEVRPKKTGVYFFSSQPKVAGPNMTHDSTDGETEATANSAVSNVRPPQKSSLLPQKAGDSPQHAGRGAAGESSTSSSSQAEAGRRVAMLRRSLREISQSALQQRVQQQQQQRAILNLDHLAPADVSESFERRMLADMKAENEEEDEETDNKVTKLPSLPHLQQQLHAHPTIVTRQQARRNAGAMRSSESVPEEEIRVDMHQRLHLSDESSEGEEMSTGRSTYRGPPPGPADSSYYIQEMQMCWPGKGGGQATTRLSQETMPLEMAAVSPIPPPSGSQKSPSVNSIVPGHRESQDDYLDLRFDPDLNCYYDPETGKYYELV